jgi:hypothetical protein
MAKSHTISHHAIPRHGKAGAVKSRPVAKSSGHGGVIALGLGGLAAAALGLWLAAGPIDPATADPTEGLLAEMQLAAGGSGVPATHAFGGTLAVTYGNGRMNVTAAGLPAKPCVQIGWHLAKQGTIIVNGVLPMRLSAARLSELCSDRDGGATLTWVPDGK